MKSNINILHRHTWILVLLCCLLFSSCQKDFLFLYPHKRVIQLGDNMAWAQPEFDDSKWEVSGSTMEIGKFWVRFHIEFDDRVNQLDHKGIHMISLGSYEAYWDGVLIHQNGKIANNKENEVEGQFISQMLIPDSLCQIGQHVLALRLSNLHNDPLTSWSWNTFKIEEYNFSAKAELRITAFMFIPGGCFLLVSLYYLFLFIKEKREPTTLVFSIICLMFFTLLIFEYLKFYWSYPYSFHNTRLIIIGTLTAIIAFIVPLFLCLFFDIPKKRILLAILLLSILLISYIYNIKFDDTNQLLSSIMLVVSTLISAFACWLKRKDSILVLFAFLIVIAINYFSTFNFNFTLFSYDINLFLSFLILVLTILYLLTRQRKKQQLAYEASLLLSERLKNELLRKNIQPHFIMNTLTSIMEWVERSPKKSIELIEALADEFDLLNDISDEKLIPINQEIDLCKKHLEIMTFRKEVVYKWSDENIDLSKHIPPAIFHTLVENGITHSKPINGQVKFKLSQENVPKGVIYKMEVIAQNRKSKSPIGSGTGLKYIKSRLTESYEDQWSLVSRESPTGWITEVSILK